MYGNLIRLAVVFAVIVAIIWKKKPLHWAFFFGSITAALLCMIPLGDCVRVVWDTTTSWPKMAIVVDIYLITFLQKLLDRRSQIQKAQQDMLDLFNNRIVNTMLLPVVIGFLPSPAALTLCGQIVQESTDGYLDAKEQAISTSYFRHVPEAFLPTYPIVLLLCGISGMPIAKFVVAMIPPVLVLLVTGWFFYLRKVPARTGHTARVPKGRALWGLVKHTWSLFLVLVLILGFKLSVELAMLIDLALCLIVYRIRPKEFLELIPESFDRNVVLGAYVIFVFQGFLARAGIMGSLVDAFQLLPIPADLMFTLLIFVGGVLTGAQGIIAVAAPLAFAAVPGFGVPFLILLGCSAWAANQLSPTHVCVVVAANYFHVNFSDLVKKVIPAVIVYMVFAFAYYYLTRGLF